MAKSILPSYAKDAHRTLLETLNRVHIARNYDIDLALTKIASSPFGLVRTATPHTGTSLHDPDFRDYRASIYKLELREQLLACFKTAAEWSTFVRDGTFPFPSSGIDPRRETDNAIVMSGLANELRKAEIFRIKSGDISANPRIPMHQPWTSPGHIPVIDTQVLDLVQDGVPENNVRTMITHVLLDRNPLRPESSRSPQHLLFLTLLPCGERWNNDIMQPTFERVIKSLSSNGLTIKHFCPVSIFLHTPPENNISARKMGKNAPDRETLEYFGNIVPIIGGLNFNPLSEPLLCDVRPRMLDDLVARQTAPLWKEEEHNPLKLIYERAISDHDHKTADIADTLHLHGLLRHFRTLRQDLEDGPALSPIRPTLAS